MDPAQTRDLAVPVLVWVARLAGYTSGSPFRDFRAKSSFIARLERSPDPRCVLGTNAPA